MGTTEEFSRDRFAAVVGTTFTLSAADDKTLEIELSEVSDLRERPHQQSYSILFRLPENIVVEQGMYDLRHPELGAIQLFLVPIAPVENRMRLEAVFNFLRTEEKPANA